jgi:hypothetical protein
MCEFPGKPGRAAHHTPSRAAPPISARIRTRAGIKIRSPYLMGSVGSSAASRRGTLVGVHAGLYCWLEPGRFPKEVRAQDHAYQVESHGTPQIAEAGETFRLGEHASQDPNDSYQACCKQQDTNDPIDCFHDAPPFSRLLGSQRPNSQP